MTQYRKEQQIPVGQLEAEPVELENSTGGHLEGRSPGVVCLPSDSFAS